MAAVLPIRPNTNSSGHSAGSGPSHHGPQRQPSLSSFPGSASHRRMGPTSAVDDSKAANQMPPLPTSSHSNHSGPRPPHPLTIPRSLPSKRIKSQYPADSPEKHVEYILVASFDIDRGSVMEHQFPGPVGGDEHMLAELMLPDQAHVRTQDWTIFFLHKDAPPEDEDGGRPRRKKRRKAAPVDQIEDVGSAGEEEDDGEAEVDEVDEVDSDDDTAFMDGPPLVYVLNLVNTKYDAQTRRGAIVKAMAVCTRHPFLHIYKPLLLLALEQYFANPVIEQLVELYDAVNSMDLSLMPRLTISERFVLWSSDAKDLFLDKFETMIAQRMADKERGNQSSTSLAPPSPPMPARGRYGLPRDTHEFESVVNYKGVPVPVKIPTALSPETVGDFSLIKLITTFSAPHTSSPTPFHPTHPHLTTSGSHTHPIIVLLNALLTQKRVIFLGHNLPSSEVADAVLGACALASGGILRGFIRHAFPYTDLTKIDDLLQVPGFIAGVTNPAFAHKTEWWDLLCDLSTGRMRISSSIESAPLTEGVVFFQQSQGNSMLGTSAASGSIGAIAAAGASLSAGLGGTMGATHTNPDATGDAAFVADIVKSIEERHGENAIRAKFRRWILKFTRLASTFEEIVYGATTLHAQPPSASPWTEFDSPVGDNSPSRSKLSASPSNADRRLPLEITGHGYVWASPQAKSQELTANATRIEGWRTTRSYQNFISDLAAYINHRPIKELDLQHLHDKLAKLRLGAEASVNIYIAICAAVNTDQEICQLLGIVANAGGPGGPGQGLFYIALGLFHAKQEVREHVADLLLRIQEHEAGRHYWKALGRFARMAWERVMQKRHLRNGRPEEGMHE